MRNEPNTLAEFTRAWGATRVLAEVRKVADEIVELEKAVNLPDGFRFFEEHDWYGYADAGRFVDGVRPVVGQFTVTDEDGVDQQALVVIARDEETGGAVVEYTTYGNHADDEENATGETTRDRIYQATFTNLRHAIGVFHLVQKPTKPVLVAEFNLVFGFKQIN